MNSSTKRFLFLFVWLVVVTTLAKLVIAYFNPNYGPVLTWSKMTTVVIIGAVAAATMVYVEQKNANKPKA